MIYRLFLGETLEGPPHEKYQDCLSLNEVFATLKERGHINILTLETDKKVFLEAAGEENADIEVTPICVQPSVSSESTFVESLEIWINEYMVNSFDSPDMRPYIEVLL